MSVGDLVKMKRGYSSYGIVMSINERISPNKKWVRVLWSDEGPSLEKARDLNVIQYVYR